VPYEDLLETDEPLVELETPEEDTRCQLWEDTSPMINLLSESTNGFQSESPKTPEKSVLSDLKGILAYLFRRDLSIEQIQNLFNNVCLLSFFKIKRNLTFLIYLQIIGQSIQTGNHCTLEQRLEKNVVAYGELIQEVYGLQHPGVPLHLP